MKISWISIILLLCTLPVFGQEEETENNETGGVAGSKVVDISRTVNIQDAKKLSIPVQIDKIGVRDPEYDYSIKPTLFEVNPSYSEPIQPIKLGEVKMPELSSSYAVFGFGNYRNAFADIHLSSKRDRNKAYDLNLKHRSGKAPSRYSGFGNNELNLNAERIYSKHTLRIGSDLGYNRVHHYGFYSDSIPDSVNINPDTIVTDYLNLGLSLYYDNLKSKSEKHKYTSYLLPYFFSSSQGEFEWAAVAGGNLKEPLTDNSFLSFDLEYDYNAYYLNESNWLRNIVRVGANYNYTKDAFKIKAGLKTASDNYTPPGDTVGSTNSIYFFPDVKAEYTLGDNLIKAYANIGGGLTKNSLRSISQINPFINTEIRLQNTIERISVEGGLKGNLFRELNYHLFGSYKSMDKMLLFVNIDSALNYFKPVYTGTNTGIFKTGAELSYKQYERLLIHLKGTYYQYSFVNNEAWNLPTFDLRLTAQYNFQEKMIAYMDVYALNSRIGTNESRTETWNIDGAIDIGLGLDYQFNSKTYFYAKLNNLLHQKYMVWNGYQVQGFHLMAGIKIQL